NIELARKVTEEDHSLSHPPGLTPEEGLNEGNNVNLDMKDYGENKRDDNSFVNLEDVTSGGPGIDGFDKLVEDFFGTCSSLLRLFIRVEFRQVMNYFLKEEFASSDEHRNIAQKAKIKWSIEENEKVKFLFMKEDMESDFLKRRLKVLGEGLRFDKSPCPDGFPLAFNRHLFVPVIEKGDCSRLLIKSSYSIHICLGRKLGEIGSRNASLERSGGQEISRLSRWKMKLLSIGDNSTLLKSDITPIVSIRLDNSFRRKARSGIEEMQLNSLAEISRMTTLVPCEDRYVWTLESDGVFSVASIQKEMGIVKSNALPTRFNISRRGMDIDSIVCPICNAGVESTNHIFFQCVVVRHIMRKISSWWNIDYSDVNSYEEWRVWLVSIRIQSKLKGVLEGVYYGLWWYMWNFCNKLLFDKKIPEKALIFDNLVSSSFYWCKFRCKASFKWDDWLKNPYIVLV
ncbi:RNA-directed DNA polymerase, eukaryota, partial [Tanacetum coccineum]